MHILYIHQYFSTRQGSSGTRSYEFSKYLISKGHKVTLISGGSRISTDQGTKFVYRENIDGINLIAFRIQYSNYQKPLARILSFLLFTFFATIYVIKHKKVDVILATSTPLTVGIPGIIGSRLKKIPFVFEIRDLWPDIPIAIGVLRNRLLIALAKRLESACYRQAIKLIVLSHGTQKLLQKKHIRSEKIVLIPNCSDLDLFIPNNIDTQFRGAHNLEDKFIAIHTGAMGFVNGLDLVIETAKILKAQSEEGIALVLIGDGKERPHLIELKERWELHNLIILDPVARAQLAGILGACDIGLMLVRNFKIFEANSANKFFDYLSSGKPVIINYSGWMKEILDNSAAGMAVSPDRPEELAQTLLDLSKNPEKCLSMGYNARKLAEEKFDRKKLAEKFEKVLVEAAH